MITEVSLDAFKCFEHLQSVLLKRVNLFAGCNGRGKSTFLQSLLLLAQSIDSEKRLNHIEMNGRFVELGCYEDVVCIHNNANPMIHIKTDDKQENDIFIRFTVYKDKEQWGKLISLKVGDRELIEQIGSAKGANNEKGDFVLGSTSTVLGLSQLYNVYFVAADRMGPMDSVKRNDNRADNQIGKHGEFILNDMFRKDESFMQRMVEEMSIILSGASITVEREGKDYLRLLLDSTNGSKGFRPSNVGFGYSYILPIVFTVLSAEKGAKIFIENPEAHLHPGAQSRLMNFIIKYAVKNDLQMFIETHSDHLMNGLRIAVKNSYLSKEDACILFFDRKSNESPQCVQIKIDKEGNLSAYPDGFMDEWGAQMCQLV